MTETGEVSIPKVRVLPPSEKSDESQNGIGDQVISAAECQTQNESSGNACQEKAESSDNLEDNATSPHAEEDVRSPERSKGDSSRDSAEAASCSSSAEMQHKSCPSFPSPCSQGVVSIPEECGGQSCSLEPAPEDTALSAQVSKDYFKHFANTVSNLESTIANLSSRLEKLENLMPICAQHIDHLSVFSQELSSQIESSKKERKSLQISMSDLVFEQTRLQKQTEETLQKHTWHVKSVAQETAANEMEILSRHIGCQVQNIFDEVRQLRMSIGTRQHDDKFIRTLNSLKSSWECLSSPWCSTELDPEPPCRNAEGLFEMATSERECGEFGGDGGRPVLPIQPCIALGADMSFEDKPSERSKASPSTHATPTAFQQQKESTHVDLDDMPRVPRVLTNSSILQSPSEGIRAQGASAKCAGSTTPIPTESSKLPTWHMSDSETAAVLEKKEGTMKSTIALL